MIKRKVKKSKCIVEWCNRAKYFTTDYCRRHHFMMWSKGKIIKTQMDYTKKPYCIVDKCEVETVGYRGECGKYCRKHLIRLWNSKDILKRTIYDKNIIIKKENYAILILKNRQQKTVGRSLIDLEDIEKISKIKWHLTNHGYVYGGTRGIYKLHQVVMDFKFIKGINKVIDHINKDKLDNRKNNLRICTYSENSKNHLPYKRMKLRR